MSFRFNPITAKLDLVNPASAPGGNNTDVQFNDSGVFNGTDDLTFDKTNVRLGIGVATPAHVVDISSDSNIIMTAKSSSIFNGIDISNSTTTSEVGLFVGGSASSFPDLAFIFMNANNGLAFIGGTGTQNIRVLSNGNVGIANINPNKLLQLGTAGATRGVLGFAGNTSGNVTLQPAAIAGTWTLTLPITGGTNKFFLQTNGSGATTWAAAQTVVAGGIAVTFQGNGSTIAASTKAYAVYFPYSGIITSASLLADAAAGSIVIDIWKAAYATVPTITNTIVASAPPTLSSAQVSRDTTLTGWSTTVTAGDNWIFNVNSATTVQTVTLTLEITRT